MSGIYEVNKYGAIDPKHIAKIEETIQELIEEIGKIREDIGRSGGWFEFAMHGYCGFPCGGYYEPLSQRLAKLEKLTKADGYEYKTETKLVKKPNLSMTATEAMKTNKNK